MSHAGQAEMVTACYHSDQALFGRVFKLNAKGKQMNEKGEGQQKLPMPNPKNWFHAKTEEHMKDYIIFFYCSAESTNYFLKKQTKNTN